MPADRRVVLPMLLLSAVFLCARAASAGSPDPPAAAPAPAAAPEKTVYLTFDDGPSEITPTLLDVLKEHEAAATFFVCGNVTEFGNTVYNRILDEWTRIFRKEFVMVVPTDYKRVLLERAAREEEIETAVQAEHASI